MYKYILNSVKPTENLGGQNGQKMSNILCTWVYVYVYVYIYIYLFILMEYK